MTKEESYPTNLTDEQFEFIKQFVPESSKFGRPCLNLRQVLNALFYVVVGGIAWRMLPKDLPKWKSVYHYFWKWRKSGEWKRIYDALHELERLRQGRQTEASAGCLDWQSVKNVGGKQQERGDDAGKRITGRKRHLLVDTLGLPIAVKVTSASASDQAGARSLFAENKEQIKSVKKIWVDRTYRGAEWHEGSQTRLRDRIGSEQKSWRRERVYRASQKMGGRENFWVEHSSAAISARIREISRK